MPRVSPVFSFYAKMLLAFGLIFQMPTLVFFLARFGLVTARFLIRYFKYAVLIIFIVAAVLTPGTDVVSQLMMAIPMLALYAISIVIAWLFGKKKTAAA
jgi:sec-independent protein translocase protein TatC